MSESLLQDDLGHFLSGWLAARGENLKGFALALVTDEFTQSTYPEDQDIATTLGLTLFAHESARDDLKREFDAIAD